MAPDQVRLEIALDARPLVLAEPWRPIASDATRFARPLVVLRQRRSGDLSAAAPQGSGSGFHRLVTQALLGRLLRQVQRRPEGLQPFATDGVEGVRQGQD